MLASVIIRTLNEAAHLDELLCAVEAQATNGIDWEVLLVDSGSTDATLEIARRHGCQILHIRREEFSFGRSLNMGCRAAKGELLVLISGHCVPSDRQWLQCLCRPLLERQAQYTYGRQIGCSASYFSECRIFAKYFPERSSIPQDGFFCNNANAALTRTTWEQHGFDEELTGLEDMDLARRLVAAGGKLAYVADACVYHHHNETWTQVKRRFEREAISLQHIMPQVHVNMRDLVRYVCSSIWLDWKNAYKDKVFGRKCLEIVQYRLCQYWGVYRGNHEHRRLSHAQKERYFYPG